MAEVIGAGLTGGRYRAVRATEHGIEALERQGQEQFDASAQRDRRVEERLALLFRCLRPLPGQARPNGPDTGLPGQRASLAGGVVADGEDEVEYRRTRRYELVPALAAVAGRRQAQALQRGECQRMHFAFRVAASRIGVEAALAQFVEQPFSGSNEPELPVQMNSAL